MRQSHIDSQNGYQNIKKRNKNYVMKIEILLVLLELHLVF